MMRFARNEGLAALPIFQPIPISHYRPLKISWTFGNTACWQGYWGGESFSADCSNRF
jgi:hypothetical protein